MMKISEQQKVIIDELGNIVINSYLKYADGYALIEKVEQQIIINELIPFSCILIRFRDVDYERSITKDDAERILKLLDEMGFCDQEYIEEFEYEDIY